MSGAVMLDIIMHRLKELYFRGYEARKHDIESDIVSRFARGNVLVQDGHYMTKNELDKLSSEGDRALRRLENASQ